MSVGDDLKETFQDVGTSFTIIRESGDVTGEYLIYEINRQVTKPFVREFFLEAELAYDSAVEAGDVVQLSDLRIFLVANKSPEHFENAIVEHQCVLYKCNVINGTLWRSSGEDWDSNYHKDYNWQIIASGERALMTEALYGHDLETDEELGQFGLENHEVYFRGDIDIIALDRWEPFSGEFYMVTTIKRRRYEELTIVEVSMDTRTVPGDQHLGPF